MMIACSVAVIMSIETGMSNNRRTMNFNKGDIFVMTKNPALTGQAVKN